MIIDIKQLKLIESFDLRRESEAERDSLRTETATTMVGITAVSSLRKAKDAANAWLAKFDARRAGK